MFDDNHCVSLLDKLLKGLQKDRHVIGMESYSGLIKKVQDVCVLLVDEIVSQFDPLELSPRESRRWLAQP